MGGRATFPWQFFRNPARNDDSERAHLPIPFVSWFISRFVMAEFEIVSVRADPPRAGVNQRTRAFSFLFIPGSIVRIISFCN